MKHTVFIGVDLTAGARPITHVVLNARRDIVAQGDTDFDGAVEAISQYPRAVCAIDAPQGHNAGLMADPDYRRGLGLRAHSARYRTYRVCEYELRRRGIGLYNTPPDPGSAPAWMQAGWRFYAALRAAGFMIWPADGPRQMMEVHPHASFTAVLARRPLKKTALEGRLQRQVALYRAGVGVPDPIMALEELTPHRLLMGDLRMGGLLYDHDTLDAAAAAYTAWLAATHPEQVTAAGDPDEGTIVVPAAPLLNKYPR